MQIPDGAPSGPTDTQNCRQERVGIFETILNYTNRTADTTTCIVWKAVLYTARCPTLTL
jgi:hypothetical protein